MRRRYYFDGPDRAVHFASGMPRRLRRRRPPYFLGVIFLVLGVLFFLDALDLVVARNIIRTWWPVLLIVWGSARLLFGWPGERVIGAGALVIGSLLLGNRLLDFGIEIWRVVWSLVFIALGLHILLHRRRWRDEGPTTRAEPPVPPIPGAPVVEGETIAAEPDETADVSATFKEVAVMAGIERKNVSQALRGGDVTVVMGGVEIDLRDSRMAGDELRVGVSVVMGEVVFRIPREWTVESRVSATLANFEDRTAPPVDAAAKRFAIEGSAFMGNVEIRN
jgi:hypothetical protein